MNIFVSCSNGRYLVSGGTDGCVYGWDVESGGGEREGQLSLEEKVLEPILHCQTHVDAVNGTRQAYVMWEPIVYTH